MMEGEGMMGKGTVIWEGMTGFYKPRPKQEGSVKHTDYPRYSV